jgi:hypothetical protein
MYTNSEKIEMIEEIKTLLKEIDDMDTKMVNYSETIEKEIEISINENN